MVYESEDSKFWSYLVFRFLNGEIPRVIREVDYLFDRSQFSKKVKENKEFYHELFLKLIQIFNFSEVEEEESENSQSEVE